VKDLKKRRIGFFLSSIFLHSREKKKDEERKTRKKKNQLFFSLLDDEEEERQFHKTQHIHYELLGKEDEEILMERKSSNE
jgi:negative regulator of genetic competence, sporulation and motility